MKMTNEEKIVKSVLDEFEIRKLERKNYETSWLMNMNFYIGNQYCNIGYGGNLEDLDKQYFWQEREVFNHIAPIIDVRMAKLARIKPKTEVLPSTSSESDIASAKVAKKILESTASSVKLDQKILEATNWSEICGTSFYKITWNSHDGMVVARDEEGGNVRSGEVNVTAISPFEIYPSSPTCESVEGQQSIIHARAMDREKVKSLYGIEVDGQPISVFSLSSTEVGFGGLGYASSAPKVCEEIKKDSVIVLERYERASESYPNGRLTIVVGNKLYYDGDNPFKVGLEGKSGFPFVKQVCLSQVGSFWGVSVIDRLIPVQRAFNAVKNRKHELMNRLTMGVLKVEDGSVDVDDLEEDGLCPGKILIYRQGSTSPQYLEGENISSAFSDEEEKLLNEFKSISGINDTYDATYASSNISGTALELLIEQDEMRLNSSAEQMKISVKNVSQMILRLYKQFAIIPRLARLVGENGKVELFYFSSNDLSSDDVILQTDTELGESLSQRRKMVFDILSSGLLYNEEGKLTNKMKAKVLEMLGLGIWEGAQDLNELHLSKANKENFAFKQGKDVSVLEVDDHAVHIDAHTALLIGGEGESLDGQTKDKILSHIKEHEKFLKE